MYTTHTPSYYLGLVALVTMASGCQKTPASQDLAPSMDSAHTIDQAQLAADGAGPAQFAMGTPQPAQAAVGKGPAFVTQTALVRREAKDVKDVEVKGSKKRLSNFTATLYRGEQVEVVGTDDAWVEVQTSDEKRGWLKLDNVLRAEGVAMATVVSAAKVFTRPDLLAFNGAKTIMPGTLLFAMRQKDQFSEVNLGGGTSGWVLTDVLVKDKREVDVAKLINKARLLKDRSDPAADGMLELAKAHFGDTHLVQTLLLASPAAQNANDPSAVLPGPSNLGAPGVASTVQKNAEPAHHDVPVVPAGMPAGGVDTAPSAPQPVGHDAPAPRDAGD